MDSNTLLFFILSLFIGAILGAGMYFFLSRRKSGNGNSKVEATVLVERIEKVFKVVMAEGYFTEIYNYQNDKSIWNLINDKKKALIIAKAKVLVGYDFGKMRYHISEIDKKVIIDFFPEPEVLSMDTDYKFYDIEQGWLNRFQSDDYTAILNEAKQTMNEKALQSDLPRIATNQVQLMMFQLAATMNWKIDMQLPEANKKELEEYTTYRPTDAGIDNLDWKRD
ncbi:DUF4230 domain-containing protein [Dyadobacter psychrotolerans]|uniref:DUF4230 domain-containing protein n=1 Tax=Dyadobacter psychrotolerans TaxID=2541721 RepID=A0A4R5DWA6_9BACT|nr:DUF4230 domain-containing protein [Dyadobacter psychrotolerans]TDE16680.1 DUF4230 domain-containing protein [Dyadobacter psychrotolerans]